MKKLIIFILYLGNVSKDFSFGNLKNTRLYDMCIIFQLIMILLMLLIFLHIHKHLMEKHDIK